MPWELQRRSGNITAKKTGWLQKKLYKKRNLFFLRAGEGHFYVSFILGEQATQCVRESGVSPGYIEALEKSRRYAEGRVLIVKVENGGALRNVLKLLRCKIDH